MTSTNQQGFFKLTELFAKDKKGNTRIWSIWAENFRIQFHHGLVNGMKTPEHEEIPYGKGGRTRQEQMMLRINRLIQNKIDSGYCYNLNDAENKQRTNSMGLPRPMLAQKFNHNKHNDFSNYLLQPKYNGFRCLTFIEFDFPRKQQIISYTRKGTEIKTISHIQNYLLDSFVIKQKEIKHKKIILDGELYNHNATFQKISSWVKREQADTYNLEYVLYDVILFDSFLTYEKRYEIIKLFNYMNTKVAPIEQCVDLKSINDFYLSSLKKGYEGAIVRNKNSPYQDSARSENLLKVKSIIGSGKVFDNEMEFLVQDIFKSAKGVTTVICSTKEGKEFKVVAPGTMFEKEIHFDNRDKLIGQYLTVRFSEWTEYEKPFHPVAIKFRDPSFD